MVRIFVCEGGRFLPRLSSRMISIVAAFDIDLLFGLNAFNVFLCFRPVCALFSRNLLRNEAYRIRIVGRVGRWLANRRYAKQFSEARIGVNGSLQHLEIRLDRLAGNIVAHEVVGSMQQGPQYLGTDRVQRLMRCEGREDPAEIICFDSFDSHRPAFVYRYQCLARWYVVQWHRRAPLKNIDVWNEGACWSRPRNTLVDIR